MTEKRFRLGADFDGFNNIYDNERTIGCERTIYATKMVKLLNDLHEEKEDWKNNCLQSVNENSILWNEISILMEQGAEPSNAFKNYLNGLKNKNKKLEGDLE